MLFSCFYKSFYIFQEFSFCLNATASKGKEILHVLLLKLQQGLHEKIPHAWSPAWAPIDGREGKSTPVKETNRCFIHGCINKSVLINNEIRSLPPRADRLTAFSKARLGWNPRGVCHSCKWAWKLVPKWQPCKPSVLPTSLCRGLASSLDLDICNYLKTCLLPLVSYPV